MSLATRLAVGTAAILLAAITLLAVTGTRSTRDRLELGLATELGNQARLIAGSLVREPRQLAQIARDQGALLGRRVTFIDPEGRVVGDSEFDQASLRLLDNQLRWPEVADALAGRRGVARRVSNSTNRLELKVAVPSPWGAVRVSAPLAEVDQAVAQVQRVLLLSGAFALALGLGLAVAAGRAIQRPLRRLADAAHDMAMGDPPEYPTSSVPELRHLAGTLRAMQQELGRRMGELKRERDESDALVESMAEGVLAADPEGNIVAANTAVRRLLAYRPGERLPNLREMFRQREMRELVDQILSGSTVLGRETELDGSTILLTGRSLPNGGAVLVLHDVSDLRRLDAVRRDFVANVSHELKTPLTSISGYAETLLDETADADTRNGSWKSSSPTRPGCTGWWTTSWTWRGWSRDTGR